MALSHMKGLSITPDPRGATALEVTGTTSITGDSTLSSIKVASASNSICGLAAISAAGKGSVTVSTTKALSSSRIFLSPVVNTAYATKAVGAYVSLVVTGACFKIRMYRMKTAGTIATASGRVSWLIINK